MKMPAILTRNAGSLPGLSGIARVDRNTQRLLRRIGPGDVAVLDELDLDRTTADALVRAGVAAVVNASASISGRYPNLGPDVVVAGGVVLIDATGPEIFKKIKDGTKVRLHEGVVYSGERVLVEGVELDESRISERMIEARNGLAAHLEAFSGNMIEIIRSESPLLLDGVGVPEVKLRFTDRHVVLMADGPGNLDDLKKLKPFIREYAPLLIGVDTGADALLRAGYRPDLIIGDPDQITGHALKCGAEVVLPADQDGHAAGLSRIQDLGVGAVTFPGSGSAADLALLLAHHHGAALIVTVGSSASLDDFFDRGTKGSSPTAFLTRLKVGSAAVDARAVASLYRGRMSAGVIALLVLAALAAVIVAVLVSNVGGEVGNWAIDTWNHVALKVQGMLG
jgi:uncharacterized membrane-anchored protein